MFASSYGIEDITPMHFADMSTTETTITSTKSTTNALAAGADDHDSEDVVVLESRTRERRKEKEVGKRREEIRRLRVEIHGRHASVPSKSVRRAAAAVAAALIPGRPRKPSVLSDIESYGEEESEEDADDQVLQYLLQQQGVESFQYLEEIDPFIDDEYKKRSQNKLKIKKSLPNCLCHYVCTEHAKCQYQIFVGKHLDGLFAVKRFFSHHFGHCTVTSSVASRQPRSSTNTGDDEDDMDEDEDEDNDDDDDDADDKEHDSDASFNTAKSSAEENDDDTGTVDKLLADLLMPSHVWKTFIPLSICTKRNREITYPLLGV